MHTTILSFRFVCFSISLHSPPPKGSRQRLRSFVHIPVHYYNVIINWLLDNSKVKRFNLFLLCSNNRLLGSLTNDSYSHRGEASRSGMACIPAYKAARQRQPLRTRHSPYALQMQVIRIWSNPFTISAQM